MFMLLFASLIAAFLYAGLGAALYLRGFSQIRQTAAGAIAAGQVKQMPDGRCGVFQGLNAASTGDRVTWQTSGQYTFPQYASVNLLDGGRAYWSVANQYITFKKAANSADFYVGRVVGDSLLQATCVVNINIPERHQHDIDLARDTFSTTIILTSGVPQLLRRGGAHQMILDSTSEAQKVDALSYDSFSVGAGAIVEARVNVVAASSSTHGILNVGIASASHATAVTSITQYLTAVLAGSGATSWHFQSADGTNSQSTTDSTVAFAAGTPQEIWFDLRNPASVKIYIDGVQVLASTTFNVSAGTASGWKLLAHLVKASSTDTETAQVDWLRARLQGVSP